MKNKTIAIGLLLALSACTDGSESGLKEAPDSRNTIGRFELNSMPSYEDIAATKQVFTKKLPWSDTYWPLTEAGMARRWGKIASNPSDLGLSSFWQDQLDQINTKKLNVNLSPGEKYDILYRSRWQKTTDENLLKDEINALLEVEKSIKDASDVTAKRKVIADLFTTFGKSKTLKSWSPMAAEGWDRWLTYNKSSRYQYRDEKDSGEDWSWMGYCHGWAPAALMHDAPKHSVLVKIDDKEILFGEGDIRGLLTKAWADHSPDDDQYFLGRRCNENTAEAHGEIPMAGDTRGATGTYTSADGSVTTFTMMDEYLPGAAASGRRIYQIMVNQSAAGYLIEKTASGKVSYFLSSDTQAMKSFVESGDTDALTAVKTVKFYGCWDVNPASFHTVLTEYLGKKNLGFVMDRTRTGQVWNQPVYGARFTVGPLEDAAAVDDALFRYRAPGTAFLSVVQAEVLWSSEPAKPSLDYAADFDQKRISSIKYTYTLEFDADHKLIGGEWGDLKATDTKLVIPDFLYAFREGSEPVDALASGFDFSGILKPIHACSQATTGIKSMTVDGKKVEYTECVIPRAN
ncbi:MAG: hypothetical protein EOP07_05360 [Proteobacteria bacterium]|nr:MAG: hypothetical protein EOP07_05360 [Pseudomonadota bacterium]